MNRASLTTIIVAALSLIATAAHAIELQEFYRGVRAMGMGNAFTAIADDADAVFYNPAGLAHNRRIRFHLFNPKLEASKDGIQTVRSAAGNASSLDAAAISSFFGKNIYASASVFPSIQVPGFVMGYYYGAQLHFVSRNVAMPRVEARYTLDRGVITGFGHEFRGVSRRHYARAGVSLKWLSRQGYEGVIPFSKLATANQVYLKSLIGDSATGWGVDFGFQYEIPITRNNEIILAAAWHDIGDTSFGNSLKRNPPPSIRNNLAAGGALVHRIGRFAGQTADIKFTAEGRHLAQKNVDPRLRTHIGAELTVGDLSVQGGLNQSSLGGGVALDLYFLKVSAVTYGVDNQSYAFMDRERRYMIQLDLKLDIGGKVMRTKREEDRRRRPREY